MGHMPFRYLAEIIPPADTAVEAFETVVGEEEEEAEVCNSQYLYTNFKINRECFLLEFCQGHGDGPTCSFRQRTEGQLLGEILNKSGLFTLFVTISHRA